MQSNATLTAEEMRVSAYLDATHPTVPSKVTRSTSLDSLNLNWAEKDLPEKERTKHVHRLHPYLGKFIPQIVEIFLRKYFEPGQTVLDPFSGSGTTLVQANELGINSIGCDISAFNILLGYAKTAPYNLDKVYQEVTDIIEKTRSKTKEAYNSTQLENCNLQLNLLNADRAKSSYLQSDSQYLQQWFAPQALHELITYRDLITTEGYEYQALLKIILSRSARSARLTTHFDLDFPKQPQREPYWCYKHSRECRPTTEAFKFIKRYGFDTLKRVEEFATKRTCARVDLCHTDSREAMFPSIHGVITSPPYVGLIDYHEQHAYAYHLLDLEDKRVQEIGAASGGSSQKAKRQYQKDIAAVFQQAAISLPTGGRMIVIAGDRASLYPEIANLAGLEVEATVQRHVNRRTGRRSGEFYESVFVWRKP